MLQTIERRKSADRRQASVALKISEERHRRVFEAAQDGIFLLDAQTGKITDVNPSVTSILGYSHTEIVGKRLWELSAFKDIEQSREVFKDLQTKEHIRYKDLPLRTKDGQSVSVEFVSSIYQVNEEKVIQCNIRDITRHKQAEEERKKLIEGLSYALAETLNGLLPICSYCKSIRDDKGEWKKIEEYLLEHSEANFTHGICPKCMKIFHPNRGR